MLVEIVQIGPAPAPGMLKSSIDSRDEAQRHATIPIDWCLRRSVRRALLVSGYTACLIKSSYARVAREAARTMATSNA